ncbi:MAG: hypothetical protein COB93_03535 [Sneathiella sp.]|nr:MAG: hypothetical protein COB93_03535 [Sneathiella sp.]
MMNYISVDFLLNILLVGLLLATIGYCALLNKRLSVLRGAHQELRDLSAAFDQSIVKSRLGVNELKLVAESAGREIKAEISQAKDLIEELQMINASSTRIADRLQKNTVTKPAPRLHVPFADDPAGLFGTEEETSNVVSHTPRAFRTEAEKELFNMLRKAS